MLYQSVYDSDTAPERIVGRGNNEAISALVLHNLHLFLCAYNVNETSSIVGT